MDKFKISKDDAKMIFIKMLNGGGKPKDISDKTAAEQQEAQSTRE